MPKKLFLLLGILFFVSCNDTKNQKKTSPAKGTEVQIEYAEGFSIKEFSGYKLLTVSSPWPEAKKPFIYALVEKGATIPNSIPYDQKINIPLKRVVVTSTTHIPSLESLGEENTLVGFPNLDYISSKKTRQRIEKNSVKEVGNNESMNTEILLNLQPDVVIGFSIESDNKTYSTLMKSGIPVVYNGDWTEKSPLGKAEWIKFFGAFYNKGAVADSIFNTVKSEYLSAKKLVMKTQKKPKVLAGAMYKDVWYAPYGNSWQAQFIKDANAQYIYGDTSGKGSISLAFESVLNKAQHADFWIAPGTFTSYKAMQEASNHYAQFDAFQQKRIYSFALTTGKTGGVLYYEVAPNRPDLVLKDMIKIFHPEVLPNYVPVFFKPLN